MDGTGGGKIKRGADRHYPLMSTKNIMALDVPSIAAYIRYAIKDHGCFGEEAMARVYDYVDGTEEEANKYYHNPLVTWFAKGLAKGAAWACVGLEARME